MKEKYAQTNYAYVLIVVLAGTPTLASIVVHDNNIYICIVATAVDSSNTNRVAMHSTTTVGAHRFCTDFTFCLNIALRNLSLVVESTSRIHLREVLACVNC